MYTGYHDAHEDDEDDNSIQLKSMIGFHRLGRRFWFPLFWTGLVLLMLVIDVPSVCWLWFIQLLLVFWIKVYNLFEIG